MIGSRRSSQPFTGWCLFLAAGFIFSVTACGLFGDDDLVVTLETSGATKSPSEPVTLTVTAKNTGNTRACWGKGSSTCQLNALVRVDGHNYSVAISRTCTADYRDLCLDPGKTRTEHFVWSGHVRGDVLPAGVYRVRGAAGVKEYSPPRWVAVDSSQ
jgi:hypothetical protein